MEPEFNLIVRESNFKNIFVTNFDIFVTIEEVKWDPITIKVLRDSKVFQKATKKQQKELDSMRKKHMKERTSIQKSQCSAIDKAAKGKRYVLFFTWGSPLIFKYFLWILS